MGNALAMQFSLAQMNGAESGGGAAAAVLLIVYLALMVFMIASAWRVFTKAGQPGWASLIPIYNTYIFLKIAGKPGWWLILLFIPLVNIVIGIIATVAFAKSFGKGAGFAVGLIFLPIIFFPILAWGSAQHKASAA